MNTENVSNVPVVILAGGIGVRIDESGERIAKPLLEAGGRILAAHVVDWYRTHGFRRFILAGGYQVERLHAKAEGGVFGDVEVEVVDTGTASSTAARLAAVKTHLGDAQSFGITYSDTLSNVDLTAVYEFHRHHGKIGTLVAAYLPTRFRVIGVRDGDISVRGFSARPIIQKDSINGGFYFFRKEVFELPAFRSAREISLEEEVLGALVAKGELAAFRHGDFWQHVDSERDLKAVEDHLKATASKLP